MLIKTKLIKLMSIKSLLIKVLLIKAFNKKNRLKNLNKIIYKQL
jgi:hypothetical protein